MIFVLVRFLYFFVWTCYCVVMFDSVCLWCCILGVMFAYVDESHSASGTPKGGDIYYIGALLVDDSQVRFIDTKLSELRDSVHQRFGVPSDVEFHGHCMFQYKDGWECMRGKHTQSAGIYRAAMRILAESGARVVIRGVHVSGLKERYGLWAHSPHSVALQYCLERVNFIGESESVDIAVVADKVSDPAAQEGRIRLYQSQGNTEGYYNSNLSHIRVPFYWEDSRDYFCLQMIDMALFIVARAATVDYFRPLRRSDRVVVKIADIVRPCLRNSAVYYPMLRRTVEHFF